MALKDADCSPPQRLRGTHIIVDPVSHHDGVFRAWRLEPGTYEFTARYGAPEARRQLLLFVAGLVVWLLSSLWWAGARAASPSQRLKAASTLR